MARVRDRMIGERDSRSALPYGGHDSANGFDGLGAPHLGETGAAEAEALKRESNVGMKAEQPEP